MFNNYIVINSDGIVDINGFTFFVFKYFFLFLALLGLIKMIKWIFILIKVVKSKYFNNKRQNKNMKKQQIEKTPNLKSKKLMHLNLSSDSEMASPKTSIPKFTESIMGVATAAATAASVYMDYKQKKMCPRCFNKNVE